MTEIPFVIEVVRIEEVKKHPNADRLELYRIGGWWSASIIGDFKVNDPAVFIPPDSVITTEWAEKWNVTPYCSVLPMVNGFRDPGLRIRATRLRGVPSYGLLIKPEKSMKIGDDVTKFYGIKKFEPPVKILDGIQVKDLPNLIKYNSINNISNRPEMFVEGEPVIITEKIHGSNSVVGYIKDKNGKHIYVCSSHEHRRCVEDRMYIKILFFNKLIVRDFSVVKTDWLYRKLIKLYEKFGQKYKYFYFIRHMFCGKYALPLRNEQIRLALKETSEKNNGADVLFYGEIFGPGVQDMTYGRKLPDYALFDISINGSYQSELDKQLILDKYPKILQPTILYRGPYSQSIIDEYVSGPTTMCDTKDIREPFKGREGIVIKPLEETNTLYGRKIAKYISVDYHSRRNENQTEFH